MHYFGLVDWIRKTKWVIDLGYTPTLKTRVAEKFMHKFMRNPRFIEKRQNTWKGKAKVKTFQFSGFSRLLIDCEPCRNVLKVGPLQLLLEP
jgi:hypothetical protein